VAVRPGEGYGDLVMGDMVALPPPAATFATVSEWLARDVAAPERRAPAPAPPALTRIELPVGRARVLESAVDLAGLPGVLCEPAAGGGDLCAVLLNAGPQRRIGPNRMWVEIARRWAARGVATVRFDISGIGDADGPRLGATDTDALYAPGHVAQVRAVLDDLQARGTGARFLLLGLCSGANWAFQAALQDDRVRAAVLLNPGALFYDRWTTQARSGRELTRLARLSELRRLLAGEVSPRAPVVAARAIGRWLIAWPMTLRRRWAGRLRGETNPLVAALDRLEAAGRTLDVVFTEQEHLRAELAASGDLAELGRRPGVRLELIASGADAHTLQPLWIQAHVHAHVDAALEHELERAPAREAAPAR
jgi:pimeloyl-ACP methyl ester carboxylesterase